MNKKVLIYILIGTILLLTVVGAVIYKMLPPADGNNSKQREDGLLLEGDDLNAIPAIENIVIVDGDPIQETENTDEIIEKVEEKKYYDENGKEVKPLSFTRQKSKTIEKFEKEEMIENQRFFSNYGDFTDIVVDYNAVSECVYDYEDLYTEKASINSLPSMNQVITNYKDEKLRVCAKGDEEPNRGNDLKYLYIFGTDNLKTVDLKNEDLSKYDYIELHDTNKIEYLDLGNYYPKVLQENGWENTYNHVFAGIDDTSTIKEINVSNIEMAKWFKKEVSSDCVIKVNGEPVNLDYIINKGTTVE